MDLNFTFLNKGQDPKKTGGGCKQSFGFRDRLTLLHRDPYRMMRRDWFVAFSVFVVLVLGVFAWSAYVFQGTYLIEEHAEAFTTQEQNKGVDMKDLHRVVEEYEAKKENIEHLQTSAPVVIDPS